jgi:hypothetical protein
MHFLKEPEEWGLGVYRNGEAIPWERCECAREDRDSRTPAAAWDG